MDHLHCHFLEMNGKNTGKVNKGVSWSGSKISERFMERSMINWSLA